MNNKPALFGMYKAKVKLAVTVKGDLKALFQLLLHRGVESKEVSSTIFWVFGMIQPGIEPWSPLVNTLLSWLFFSLIILAVSFCFLTLCTDFDNYFVNAHIEAMAESISMKSRTKCKVPWESLEVWNKQDKESILTQKRNPTNASNLRKTRENIPKRTIRIHWKQNWWN